MHFDDTVWVDLVRGTISPATKNELEKHLQAGCAECRQALTTWQWMYSSTQRERRNAPPADLVRMIKQEFEIRYPQTEKQGTWLATLRFDSFAQPAAAGMRTAAAATRNTRQMVYEANGINIDLHFEFHPPQSMVVVGQVLDKNNAYSMPLTLVLFNEQGAAVLETQTTEFGEFQFECDMRERLRLSFELTSSQRVQVPLHDAEDLRK
jgi:hypothetical protein